MLIAQKHYKTYKRSGGNVELETLTTFDLYGVSDDAGAGNPPAFFMPPLSIGSLLSPPDHLFEGFFHPKVGSFIRNLSVQRPLSITDATFTKAENLQNFAGTFCPVNEYTHFLNPKMPC